MRRASRQLGWASSLVALAAFASGTSNKLAEARSGHQAVLLRDGTVLVVGGVSPDGGVAQTLERFTPWVGWETVGPAVSTNTVAEQRAAMLLDGRVLLVGNGARLLDPFTGLYDARIAPLPAQPDRVDHTLTVLLDGRVLVAGGVDLGAGAPGVPALPVLGSVDNTGFLQWAPISPSPPQGALRRRHTATLLKDRKVLLAGGQHPTSSDGFDSFALFHPASGTWALTDAGFPGTRYYHSTTRRLGELVVVGNALDATSQPGNLSVDPNTGWATLSLPAAAPWSVSRGHAAVLASNGDTLFLGGYQDTNLTTPMRSVWRQSAIVFSSFSQEPDLAVARAEHTATLLLDGKVLVVGGSPGSTTWELVEPVPFHFSALGPLHVSRLGPTATMLPSGNVLLVGGENPALLEALALLDGSSALTVVPSPIPLRTGHTATLVTSDEVLILGGSRAPAVLADCWLVNAYDAGARPCAPMPQGRTHHTATLLADGRVLVAGGTGPGTGPLAEAMIYDPGPDGGTWSVLSAALGSSRADHAALLLPDGRVLLTGGRGVGTDSSEYFTPAPDGGGRFTYGPVLTRERVRHTATLLRDGRVLIAGGTDGAGVATRELELLDDGGFAAARPGTSLGDPAASHGAVALPTGDVVFAGGAGSSFSNKATRFSPLDDTVALTQLETARSQPALVLDDLGRVVLIDGAPSSGQVEHYSTFGSAPNAGSHGLVALTPVVDRRTGDWRFSLFGKWAEASEASTGGMQSSPVNVPRILFQRYENGEVVAPRDYTIDPANGVAAGITTGLAEGHWRAWAYVSGVPGFGAWFRVGSRDTSSGPGPDAGTGTGAGDGGYALTLVLAAAPDPRLVGLRVTAGVIVGAPPRTPAGRLRVRFTATPELELCDPSACPAQGSVDWDVPFIGDGGRATHQLDVRPLEAGDRHALTATLELNGVVVSTKTVPLGVEAPGLRPEICGGCSSGAPGLAALAALALLARSRRRRR